MAATACIGKISFLEYQEELNSGETLLFGKARTRGSNKHNDNSNREVDILVLASQNMLGVRQ